jgi:hypothetical protein
MPALDAQERQVVADLSRERDLAAAEVSEKTFRQ